MESRPQMCFGRAVTAEREIGKVIITLNMMESYLQQLLSTVHSHPLLGFNTETQNGAFPLQELIKISNILATEHHCSCD